MLRPRSHRLCLLLFGLAVAVSAPASAQPSDSAFGQGLLAFQEGRFQDAAGLLRQATRADRTNAEAQYLLARIFLETPLHDNNRAEHAIKQALALEPEEVRFLELRLRQYRDDSTNSASYMERLYTQKHLAKSILNHDPNNLLALIERGHVALDEYEWHVYTTAHYPNKRYFAPRKERAFAEAEDYLWQALRLAPDVPETYRLLIKLYAHAEAYEQALAMLATMQANRPNDPYTWLYRGLMQHNLNRSAEAARSFERALVHMDPERQAVYTDLSRILNDEQTDAYDQDLEGYTHSFWASRDARLLTPENERRTEHYARLVYADLFFGDPRHGVKGWDTEPGNILVRYGKPQNFQLATIRYGPTRTESFSSGIPVATSRMSTWVYADFVLTFEDMVRSGHYIYHDESEILQRVLQRDMPERYEHEEPGRRVTFPHLASAFKNPDGQADLYVPYGIPLETYDPSYPRADLTLHTGAFLIGPDGTINSLRRTEHGLRTAQIASFDANHLWIGLHYLTSPPGPVELAVEFEAPTEDALGYHRTTLTIPDFSTEAFQLSDVLLAYGVEETGSTPEPGDVARNGLSIRPAPWGVFDVNQPVYLYFEVYNVTPDTGGKTSYEVEAVLAPRDDAGGVKKLLRGVLGRKKQTGVSIRFESPGGTSQDDGQYLILDTQNQPTGPYIVTLRVRDKVTGASVEANREILLE